MSNVHQYNIQFAVNENIRTRINIWMKNEGYTKSDNVFVKGKFIEMLDKAVPEVPKLVPESLPVQSDTPQIPV